MSIRMVPLGDIADVNWGNTSITKASYVPSGYPAFSASGCDGYLPSFENDTEGVVLSAIGANCGRCFPANSKWTAIKNTITITPHQTVKSDFRFLYYYLNQSGVWPRRGGGQPFIGLGDARKVPVPRFPLEEQRRIADVLDRAEDLRAKRRIALTQLDTLTQSIFLDLFGDPITNPRKWKRVAMSEVVVGKYGIKAGPFGSSLRKADYSAQGYRVYGQEQVIAGRFDIGDYYISESKYEQLKSCAVREGDLLVSMVGSFGKVLEVPPAIEPGIINPRLIKITPNHDLITSGFLAALLTLPSTQSELGRLAHGGTMGILNAGLLRQFKVILPPIRTQSDFAYGVSTVGKLKTLHRASLRELDALFVSLQHRAFRGEL